ncbi:ribonuclease HII [Mycetocola tolaasinivorans]|uniref:Ribonuclease n=1 Tax=Mycetocola tolaasinivorans TaxID=76635 RepID=A0A3L7A4L9_9MICO|nr:ribonuclease HII [Mycetocola tolaasinivorans]RLP75044.1 ribonuclease HII [Mycetocola tolaasinivorans]
MPVVLPTDEVETLFLATGSRLVIGCDEVGRGAVAGPVAVGMAVFIPGLGTPPDGLRDSKLVSEKKRIVLEPLVRVWAPLHAVGMASAEEVDAIGIVPALALAGKRALGILHAAGADVAGATILLDGSHDWLSPGLASPLDVRTRVKADRDCVSVAAASIIAKVERDTLMQEQDAAFPQYGWASNKGYGSPTHLEALRQHGLTPQHRATWLSAYTTPENV